MSKEKYLYIDDFDDNSIQAIIDGLKDPKIIDVDFVQVKEFDELIRDYETVFQKYDGIIVDLRLDENMQKNVKFSAIGLTEELRNKSVTNTKLKEVPFILCSTDKKIQQFYNRDYSSHKLFDYLFLKESKPDWIKISKKLNSLSRGYKKINNFKPDLKKLLSIDIKFLDERMFGKLLDSDSSFPTHDYVTHILKEIIRKPGPLIDEDLLAARLGIDYKSSKDWNDLLTSSFAKSQYKGIFSDGWKRWWSDLVIKKFNTLTGQNIYSLNAKERVKLLVDKTQLKNLIPSKPIKNSISNNYWTICEYFKQPLDPLEGFRILYEEEPKPWQDQQYLSFEAASQRLGLKYGLKIHPSEKEKLEFLKKTISTKK
jgi:hypothetical protein